MKLQKLRKKYLGKEALTYDSKRIYDKKWAREQEVIYNLLKKIIKNKKSLKLLDIPVGTGRFFEFYKKFNLSVTGADVSYDMLNQAKKKAQKLNFSPKLEIKDVTRINATDNEYDIVICFRLLNWLEKKDLRKAIKELSRVSKKDIIIGIRTENPEIKLRNRIRNLKSTLMKLKKRLSGGAVTKKHKERDFLNILAFNNLKIKERILIEAKKGINSYYVYHLIKL